MSMTNALKMLLAACEDKEIGEAMFIEIIDHAICHGERAEDYIYAAAREIEKIQAYH